MCEFYLDIFVLRDVQNHGTHTNDRSLSESSAW